MSNSLINTAMSGLQAAQIALGTVSNNVTNARVPGYNRQSTVINQNGGTMTSIGFMGNGVTVTSINRQYNEFINNQLSASQAKQGALTTYSQQISQIDNLLADKANSLSNTIDDFFTSLGNVISNAEDDAARTTTIGNAKGLVNQLKSADTFLRNMENNINKGITDSVDSINNLTQQIAKLNGEITRMKGGSNAEPNALLDQRDQLVNELNKLVGVSVTQQDGGSYNVTFAGGLTLVQGTTAYKVDAVSSNANSSRITLGYDRGFGDVVEINEKFINQGELSGTLRARSEVLDNSRNQLNQLALVLGDQFNQVHRSGFDLKGEPGKDFFTFNNPDVISNSKNKGSADFKVEYADTSVVKASDYHISYDGANWKIQRASDKADISAKVTGNTLEFDGLKVEINSTNAQANDQYTLKAVSGVIGGMEVNVKDASQFAAAGTKDSGPSDNVNVKKLAELQSKKLVDGKASFSGAYASMVSTIGNQTNTANVDLKTQNNITKQLYAEQQAVSGVNMDEEYGALQSLQQYYLANAQVVQTASTLFNAILDIRR
ncbi:flagellar hook-associated protein FlgK [Photorhabdus temperata]|uniref:Flagellar hook-associated protein 1 n=2 Tax=Photorhabdus khanii TaxID=1004150 RepID=W3V4X6_9GAMM|nr:flagellar hook-associated protein FlgK [Photorhabdus khanii]ETS30165.1 flagellar hook-associated protein FlgK [Photorhabdus khanii NC19]MQL48710.1 flagellar hook-associated protein FlgK [Photorhabdus khanii]OHV55546.1 flagellar hook-associated protein FlgK [Photorhabdus temperata]